MRLDQPRDRAGTFASALVPKGARRLGGLEDMIISLYAGGMTIRDIQHRLAATLGTELSHETISNVTDAVLEEVKAWQSRPLEAFYPVIFMDALVVKVRDGAHVNNRAAHIAVGVDLDGVKHVLGIWVQASEGAKFWAGVCAQLANRARQDRHLDDLVILLGFLTDADIAREQPSKRDFQHLDLAHGKLVGDLTSPRNTPAVNDAFGILADHSLDRPRFGG